MIEDELRAAFARHEHLTPTASAVLPGIEQGYRRRRQRRLGLRATGAALLVVALLGGSAYAAEQVSGAKTSRRGQLGAGPTAAVAAGAPVNLLVLGLDGDNDLLRSDIVAVVHLPADHGRADVVTIDRNTVVSIPAGTQPAGTDKINAAYAWGGAPLAARTIEQNFGIHVDATATFTYDSLIKVIDAIGGVDLYVDARTTSIYLGADKEGRPARPFIPGKPPQPVPGVAPFVYQVGYHHLTGAQALDYVRQRYFIEGEPNGVYARDRHVRQLLRAVAKTMMSRKALDDPATLQALTSAAQHGGAALDTGGATLAALAALASGVTAIRSIGAPGAPTASGATAADAPEQLTADGRALLNAVKGDTVDAWVAAHPGLVDADR
jgi:LCP family protein required for cell wall assembly